MGSNTWGPLKTTVNLVLPKGSNLIVDSWTNFYFYRLYITSKLSFDTACSVNICIVHFFTYLSAHCAIAGWVINQNHRTTIMSDINETIQEPIEQAAKSKINSRVALFVAITATFMALCNVKDGNIVQAMSQAQAHAIDAWSYFQAKSTKQSIAENTLEILRLQNQAGSGDAIKKYEEQIARYEKEKTDIKKQAEGFQKEYDDINLFDDQFDMTDALLTISIAMFGITSLTQKNWLLYFAAAVSVTGIILGLTAFLKISLHSDLMSKILG